MYSTYILRLRGGSYYVGSTADLSARLALHQTGKVRSTKGRLPVHLLYTEEFKSRSEAQTREYQIKRWKSRAAIEQLIKK